MEMTKEVKLHQLYAGCVKPLIEAVANNGDEILNFKYLKSLLNKALRLSGELEHKIDDPVFKFITTLKESDLESSDSLLKYLQRITNYGQAHFLFDVYEFTRNLDPSYEDEISEFFQYTGSCESSKVENAGYKFTVLLRICEFSNINVDVNKVTIENLEKLATPTLEDIHNKCKEADYGKEELEEFISSLEMKLDENKISESSKKFDHSTLWKELYNELVDLIRENCQIYGDGLLMFCEVSKTMELVKKVLGKGKYRKIYRYIENAINKSGIGYNDERVIKVILEYVSSKVFNEE